MALDSAKARKKIEECKDLPALPTVVTEIINLANSPQTNAADVGQMIEQDPSITTKVLRLVNSAFYGFPGQIKTVQHAVVILGFNKVKNVVMTTTLIDMYASKTSRCLDLPLFWEHSLGVAIASKVVAEKLGLSVSPDDVFVAGLIHDLGKLILDQALPKEYAEVLEYQSQNDCLLRDAEKEILGFDHSNVGLWVTEKWKFPRPIQHAIRYHHRPIAAREDAEAVNSVHLGDIFSRALLLGNAGDDLMPSIDIQIMQHYQKGSKFLDTCLEAIIAELRNAREFFKLLDGGQKR